MIDRANSNAAIQAEIGRRLKLQRLNLNLTQEELATRCGVSRRTIVNAETSGTCTLQNLVALLRGLNRLEQLDSFLPEPPLSPIELAKLNGKQRKRASHPRNQAVSEDKAPWNWNE